MCISPGVLANGQEIACRKCRLCRDNAINDWVGRCIAESKTATVSYCFTLTYGRDQEESSPFYGLEDHPRAKVLTYSDVQKLLKLLRRHKYKFAYFVVGEYGSEKGRAHWHIVLFFYGRAPALAGFNSFGTWSDRHLSRGHDDKDKVRFNWQRLDDKGQPVTVNGKPAYWWPHGWVEVSEASAGGIRYNTKYIQKDIGKAERQGHVMPSKKPPLGARYFMRLAEDMVAQGITLRNLEYTFDEARTKKGELVRFWLVGKTAEIFVTHYIETWLRQRPGRFLPESAFLEEWLDKRAAPEVQAWRDDLSMSSRTGRKPWLDRQSWVEQFASENADDAEAIARVREWAEQLEEEEWERTVGATYVDGLGMTNSEAVKLYGKGLQALLGSGEKRDAAADSQSDERSDIDTPEHREIWSRDPQGRQAG